jgi:putative transposase
MLSYISLSSSKFYNWKNRQSTENQHNNSLPKQNWLLAWEVQAIINYRLLHMEEGYRRLTYMMLDEDVVAVSPASTYRILKREGLLVVAWHHQVTKGSGFQQPIAPHEHWHMDISYINFKGSFVYLVALIDGFSRYIVHYELRLSVEALDIEILVERARLKYPGVKPTVITDNGPQFKAKEFKIYLQEVGITHRRTRFFYPQSNGKIERFFQSCKTEATRKQSYIDLQDLEKQINEYILSYNQSRLHSSLGYITPLAMLQGRQQIIFSERKEKLRMARENRLRQRKLDESLNSVSLGKKQFA